MEYKGRSSESPIRRSRRRLLCRSKERSGAERGDPLDTLSKKFPEIVEVTDESDFVDYTPEHYEQSELDEDEDEQEEF